MSTTREKSNRGGIVRAALWALSQSARGNGVSPVLICAVSFMVVSCAADEQFQNTTWMVADVRSASHANPIAALGLGVEIRVEAKALMLRSGNSARRFPAEIEREDESALRLRLSSLEPPRTVRMKRISRTEAELTGFAADGDVTLVLRKVTK